MLDIDSQVLPQAMAWAKAHYPAAGNHRHAAFANSVAYLVTGFSGGYGGPSAREHAVSLALTGDGTVQQIQTNLGRLPMIIPDPRMRQAGEWEFAAAAQFAAPLSFGPLCDLHYRAAQIMGPHFDDDPEDLRELGEKLPQQG